MTDTFDISKTPLNFKRHRKIDGNTPSKYIEIIIEERTGKQIQRSNNE